MAEGANPKVMSSANESNSFPKGPDTLNKRANMPSKKSNTAPSIMKEMAKVKFSLKAMTLAIQPENKLQQVTALGMWRVIQFAIGDFLILV